MSWFDLSGNVALVTGASSGLGAHFARVLAEHGAQVVLAARRIERLETLAAEIRAGSGQALPLALDMADPAQFPPALARIEEALGPVDILVNNAGLAGTHGFLDAPPGETAQVFAVNQTAVWDLSQSVARRLADLKRPGSIINISSITGLRAVGGAASYAVSKAAVAHMTRIQALELSRHGIRVNAIAPGYFETELTGDFLASDAGDKLRKRIPMKRTGRLEELDGLLLLLASRRGSFMTGAVIPVDGGHLLTSL